MKTIKYNLLAILVLLTGFGFTGCSDADPEFVHSNNLISAMVCMADRNSLDDPTINGTIYEYDKNGKLLEEGFTAEEAEGGSGVITFIVPIEQRKEFDLTAVFLRATLTYDEIITHSLTYKRHNILVDEEHPDGMVISVTSGIGTVRKYRIMGIYE